MHLRRLTDTEQRANHAGAWLARTTVVDDDGWVSTTSTFYTLTKRDPKNGPLARDMPTFVQLGTHQSRPLVLGFFPDGSGFLATQRTPHASGAPMPASASLLLVGAKLVKLDGVRFHKATQQSPRHRILLDASGGSLRFDRNGEPLFQLIDGTLYSHLVPIAQAWYAQIQQDARNLWESMEGTRFAMPPTRQHPAPPWMVHRAAFESDSTHTADTDAHRAVWYAHAAGQRLARAGRVSGAWYKAPKRRGRGHVWYWKPTAFLPPKGRPIPLPADLVQAFVPGTAYDPHAVAVRRWDNKRLLDVDFFMDVAPTAHQIMAIQARA